MDEMYEVWVYDDGWHQDDGRMDHDTALLIDLGYKQAGYDTRITPAPIMTAAHWVESEEV